MNGSIALYCKDCGGMFFATCEYPMSEETADDIAECLKKGHRIETRVPTSMVRAQFGEKECETCRHREEG